jgi:hypothetical protein
MGTTGSAALSDPDALGFRANRADVRESILRGIREDNDLGAAARELANRPLAGARISAIGPAIPAMAVLVDGVADEAGSPKAGTTQVCRAKSSWRTGCPRLRGQPFAIPVAQDRGMSSEAWP